MGGTILAAGRFVFFFAAFFRFTAFLAFDFFAISASR